MSAKHAHNHNLAYEDVRMPCERSGGGVARLGVRAVVGGVFFFFFCFFV